MPITFSNTNGTGNFTLINNTNSGGLTMSLPTKYTIGQTALGGVVFYINGGGSTGTSGLVATLSSSPGPTNWGCEGTLINGANGTAIGTGLQNTLDFIADCPDNGNQAPRLARGLTEGGYSDWYLPSKDELYQLYLFDMVGGFGGNYEFWSSTQVNSTQAYSIYTFNGSWDTTAKTANIFYRAIRSF